MAFNQWTMNPLILGLNFGIIVSIGSFNALGVTVTKNASAAQRSTIDTSRTVLIWVFFLIYPGVGHETFQILQLIGFIILVCGTLIYNEIVIVPWWGFDYNTKAQRAKRELGGQGAKRSLVAQLKPAEDFAPMSPTALRFDANKN